MGLLDDAIREHLELKRRRGADPAEVARAEQEALGPVRREPEPAPVQDSVHEEPADGHFDDQPVAAPTAHPGPETFSPEEQTRILAPHERAAAGQPPAADAPPPVADAPAPVPSPSPAPVPSPSPAPPATAPPTSAPADERDRLRAEPAPHAEPDVHAAPAAESATPPHGDPAHEEPVDPRHSDIVHQPTTEWRIEDEDEPFADEQQPAAAGSDEDVLEETPDFLQETPEHDRLWFEQRPPRDFDFDD